MEGLDFSALWQSRPFMAEMLSGITVWRG